MLCPVTTSHWLLSPTWSPASNQPLEAHTKLSPCYLFPSRDSQDFSCLTYAFLHVISCLEIWVSSFSQDIYWFLSDLLELVCIFGLGCLCITICICFECVKDAFVYTFNIFLSLGSIHLHANISIYLLLHSFFIACVWCKAPQCQSALPTIKHEAKQNIISWWGMVIVVNQCGLVSGPFLGQVPRNVESETIGSRHWKNRTWKCTFEQAWNQNLTTHLYIAGSCFHKEQALRLANLSCVKTLGIYYIVEGHIFHCNFSSARGEHFLKT